MQLSRHRRHRFIMALMGFPDLYPFHHLFYHFPHLRLQVLAATSAELLVLI